MIGLSPNPAARPGVRNTRIVRERDALQTRLLMALLVLGFVLLLPFMTFVWGHAEDRRLARELREAEHHLEQARQQQRLLRAEEASLRSLDRIQARAMRDLGLAPRRPADTVVVMGGKPQPSPARPALEAEMEFALAGAVAPGRRP